MNPSGRRFLLNLLTVLALAATAWVGYLSLRLLILGQEVSMMQEIPMESELEAGGPIATATVEYYEPYPFAGFYVLETALLLLGLLNRRLTWLLLLGAGLLLVTSGMLLFSSGAAFLAAAGLILILSGWITYLRSSYG